jgi:hypothetical protein
MATVLFCWQLGAGFDHLMRARPIVKGLIERGHRVGLAFRDLSSASKVYADLPVEYLPAPIKNGGSTPYSTTVSFAHLLANIGFGSDGELAALGSALRALFTMVKPDLAFFDHSPLALLGSIGLPVRRAMLGTGFFCPPDVYPLPVLLFPRGARPNVPRIAVDEDEILARVNRVLAGWKQPPLERLSKLYHQKIDANFLATFPELDHFGARPEAQYYGPITGIGGGIPEWGDGPETRVLLYLKPSVIVPDVLTVLRERGLRVIAICHGIDAGLRRQFDSPRIRFVDEHLDPKRFSRECDFAILNANHGTACGMLLAGRPILQIPLVPEQDMFARAAHKLGVGEIVADRKNYGGIIDKAVGLLTSEKRYRDAAGEFAKRHSGYRQEQTIATILDRACELLVSV